MKKEKIKVCKRSRVAKQRKPIGSILACILVLGIAGTSGCKDDRVKVEVIDFFAKIRKQIEDWCDTNKVVCTFEKEYSDTIEKGKFISQSVDANDKVYEEDEIKIVYSLGKELSKEFKNALSAAQSYSDNLHMSKQGIYDQLKSEYGDQFTKEQAQYAIDHLDD